MALETDKANLRSESSCADDRHAAANPMPGGGCARALRFFSRIDAYLPVLADDETRRIFLERQIEGWEHRYSRFLATDGASEPATDPADPPQAADFLLTIEGLATRRSALPSITGETRMFDAKRQKCLDNAILSLLVAADQRCPAIIGQAHLLYHAGAGSTQSNAEQALTQLKSDAQDLLNAIANAEAEMKAAMLDR
jgi:hypothetical protein